MFFDAAPPPSLWTPPKPAIIRSVGELNRHERRLLERTHGLKFQEAVLPGMAMIRAGAAGKSFTFTNTYVDTAGGATINFNSCDLGVGGLIIVAVGSAQGGATRMTLVSGTIDGTAATVNITSDASSSPIAAIMSAVKPAGGTNKVISVTFSGTAPNPLNCVIGVFVYKGYSSATPVGTKQLDSGGASSLNLDANASLDGVAVGVVATDDAAATVSWTGLADERYDASPEAGARIGIASEANLVAATPRTITATLSLSNRCAGASATFL